MCLLDVLFFVLIFLRTYIVAAVADSRFLGVNNKGFLWYSFGYGFSWSCLDGMRSYPAAKEPSESV